MDIELVLIAVALAAGVIKYLLTLAKEKTALIENEDLRNALEELNDAIYDTVIDAETTAVAASKADNDGKLTKEEAARIKAEVVAKSKATLSDKSQTAIAKHFSESAIQGKIESAIERVVTERK